jgi:hypothetical protein
VEHLVSKLGRERNDISQSLEILENHSLAERNEDGFYLITIFGIDVYEASLPLTTFNNKIQERRLILEALIEPYKQNVDHWMISDDLMSRIKNSNIYYLDGIVKYLEQKELLKLRKPLGPKFFIKLTALGYELLQDVIVDNARIMSSAYETLFRLENRLRQFIESKLRSKYGPDWWDKYVSHKIKNVQDMKQRESSLSWKVSASTKT